jgi:hypothetical protein
VGVARYHDLVCFIVPSFVPVIAHSGSRPSRSATLTAPMMREMSSDGLPTLVVSESEVPISAAAAAAAAATLFG